MSNRLANEKSPYLLQHKDNPVAWYAWGPEAFQAARERDLPIFLSIGYSTCHWCHVMAHESFEDAEVGAALDKGFIAIKVDREERPDVDELYMRALQTLSGGGGWPMSVWLTPEGKPFFAGTYYPKHRFLQLLRRVTEIWERERAALLKDGDHLLSVVASADKESDKEDEQAEQDRRGFLDTFVNHFQYAFDEQEGGFGSAPKFPQTMNLMLMMRRDRIAGLNQAEVMVTKTLEQMIRGGMYDHLAGGFHRYSVDAKWLVPHFEKMLYDQALCVVTLLEAAAVYKNPEFRQAARETLDYVAREMTSPEGGFYSAQDADSLDPATGHKEEGFFATYAWSELQDFAPAELAALMEVYGVSEAGQFEGRNILHLQPGARRRDPRVPYARLEELRAAKPRPHLDDKIIAAWNGWMIWAFVTSYRFTGESRDLRSARRAWDFVNDKLWRNGELKRFYRDGVGDARGTAEDYAAMAFAGLELAQVDPDPKIAARVLELQAKLDADFWVEGESGYVTGDGRDPHLPIRLLEAHDGVSPGANSMAAHNLTRLYHLTGEARYRDRAERLFQRFFPRLKQYPSSLPFLGVALDLALSNPKVAVAEGGWAQEFARANQARFLPGVYWAHGGWPVAQGKTGGVYVCEEGRCLKPASSAEEAAKQLT